MSRPFGKVVVVGSGLIGASLAGRLKRDAAAARVTGVGRSEANLETAVSRGLIDDYATDPAQALSGADVAVLSAPVGACIEYLGRPEIFGPDTVITDAASVKAPLVAAAAASGLSDRFVGAHPMAGGTEVGAAAADPDLFAERTVVICREAASEKACGKIEALWSATGAGIVRLTAGEHDATVARTSHLPQFAVFALGAALAGRSGEDTFRALTGAGLRDTTRLAASDAAMWQSIAEANRDALLEALEEFGRELDAVTKAVREGDADALADAIGRSQAFRKDIDS